MVRMNQLVKFLWWVPIPIILSLIIDFMQSSETSGAIKFVDFLEELPAQWTFYAVVLVIIVLWQSRRTYLYASLLDHLKDKRSENPDLSKHIWSVVGELRIQAFNLHMRADALLVFVCALLFAGLYLIIFILPQLEPIGNVLVDERKEEDFKSKFGNELQALVDGRYWLKVNEDEFLRLPREEHREDIAEEVDEVLIFTSSQGKPIPIEMDGDPKLLPGEQIRTSVLSEDGRTAVLVGQRGTTIIATGIQVGENWEWKSLELADSSPERDFMLKEYEVIEMAVISGNGQTILLAANKGSVGVSKDRGKYWESQNLQQAELGNNDYITTGALSKNGDIGVLASNEGKVLTTMNGGEDWMKHDRALERGEKGIIAVLSAEGRTAVLIGNRGSVAIRTDSGEKFTKPDLGLTDRENVTTAAVDADGNTVVLASDEGSVFIISANTGNLPTQMNPVLQIDEAVAAVALSPDGKSVVFVSDGGSVYMTKDSGEKWIQHDWELKRREDVTVAKVSENGQTVLLASNRGSVLFTTDGGKNWGEQTSELEQKKWLIEAVLDGNGGKGVSVRIRRSIFVKKGNDEWGPTDLKLKFLEGIEDSVSADERSLIVGDEGSLFMTVNGWESKIQPSLDQYLEDGEDVVAAGLCIDNMAVVIGDSGSAFLTTDDGANWNPTQGLGDFDRYRFYRVEVQKSAKGCIAKMENEYYLLEPHRELDGWRNWTLPRIQEAFDGNDVLKNSIIYSRIAIFLTTGSSAHNEDRDVDGKSGQKGNRLSSGDYINDLTVLRISTLTVLFLLVHTLIRLSQYYMKLSSFWESRAYAVLLASSYADGKSKRFEDLVFALSPDAIDFRQPPKSPFGLVDLPRRRKQ